MHGTWLGRVGATLVLASLVLGAAAEAADIESGPPVGGRTKAFSVQDITGPAKGGRVCYI